MSPLSNLPPGCSESDIPGNRPEDWRWEKWIEKARGALDALGVKEGDGKAEDRIIDLLGDYYNTTYWHREECTPQDAAERVAERLAEEESES